MKLSWALGALTFPLLVIPHFLAVWLAASWTGIGLQYAFIRRSS